MISSRPGPLRPAPLNSSKANDFASPPDDDPSRRFCLRWPRWLATLAKGYASLYRFRCYGYPERFDGPAIFICWHSEETTLLPNCGFTKGRIMISRSRDGDILASVVQRWGYRVSRGSSSKGAVAALRLMRSAIDKGDNLILAVDGPGVLGAFLNPEPITWPLKLVGPYIQWARPSPGLMSLKKVGPTRGCRGLWLRWSRSLGRPCVRL